MEQFFHAGADPVTDEAGCLTLNIWTPGTDDGRRPVMFWIHGGAFTMGSGSSPWYDGTRFAVDHDVVVVSINYRLGVLGFTYLGEAAGSDYRGSGSLGIQDQAAALRWVQDNINAFGGDSTNVTIFGESAGAMSVGTLLGFPEARGLFHKAILQSGAASHIFTAAEAAELTNELIGILGLAGPGVADRLEALPVEDLLAAHEKLGARHLREGLVSRPVMDGEILARQPLEEVRDGAAAGVPLLIGTNLDEWKLFSLADPATTSTDEGRLSTMLSGLGADPTRVLTAYRRRLAEAPPADLLNAILSDTTFRLPAIRLAEAQAGAGGRAWMYLFKWRSPQFGGALGSCHALELPFVFNNLDKEGSSFFVGDEPPFELARDMNSTWAAFARTGDPRGAGLGEWPLYEPAERLTKIIDVESTIESDPMAEERVAWGEP